MVVRAGVPVRVRRGRGFGLQLRRRTARFRGREHNAHLREGRGVRYLMGLDLGQASDYSAFSVIEEHGDEYRVRHLERWPLRTPYTQIAADVARMTNAG